MFTVRKKYKHMKTNDYKLGTWIGAKAPPPVHILNWLRLGMCGRLL
jgi:hypothetical protein